MSIVEIGALAQLVGAIAILLSLVFVVIELRKIFNKTILLIRCSGVSNGRSCIMRGWKKVSRNCLLKRIALMAN